MNPLKGQVLLREPPRGYNQYGKCRIDFGIGVEFPVLFFELVSRKTKAIKTIKSGESVVLTYPYKRIGYFTKRAEATVLVTNDPYMGVIVSMECEKRYFRGVNKALLNAAKQFAQQNGLSLGHEERHILFEELVFAYSLHANDGFAGYSSPAEYTHIQQGVRAYLYDFILTLLFDKEEAVGLLKELEDNGKAEPTYAPPSNNLFIRKNKQCRIMYQGKEITTKDYSGMDYLQTILTSQDKMTYLEIIQSTRVVDLVAIKSERHLSDHASEPVSFESYTERIEELQEEYECAKENGDFQEMDAIEKEIDRLTKIVERNKHAVAVRNSQLKKIRDAVSIAIERCEERIGILNPQLGTHLSESRVKITTPGSKVVRIAYRPKQPTKWEKG